MNRCDEFEVREAHHQRRGHGLVTHRPADKRAGRCMYHTERLLSTVNVPAFPSGVECMTGDT